MKKLILSVIACIAIVLSSCNQNSPTPAPATPATPTPTPTSSMTATEAALVGDWIWDKKELYSSGNIFSIWTTTTNQILPGAATADTFYAGSHMVLKSSFYLNTATTSTLGPQQYNADYYVGSLGGGSGAWIVQSSPSGSLLSLAGGGTVLFNYGYIITLNSTTLIIHTWTPGQIANGYKYYYHK